MIVPGFWAEASARHRDAKRQLTLRRFGWSDHSQTDAQTHAEARAAEACRQQHLFLARVSAKPWRIGIQQHMRPRPGVWPLAPERLPVRLAWVQAYEARARGYAACRWVESLGHGVVHPDVAPVLE